ncbi:MAG: hypothetical protein IKF72_13205 [Kiritimatiellae bacterium]|nr:hypothetical protein [Kiritimatiellia bacterium]
MKRIGITRRTVKTIAVFGLAALAAGVVYGEDPYIESKGTADYGGISTGYRMKGSSRVEVDFALLDASNPAALDALRLFGSDGGGFEPSLMTCMRLSYNSSNGAEYFILQAQTASSTKSEKYVMGFDTVRHTAILDLPNSKMVFTTAGVTNAYSYATGPNGNDKTTNVGIDFSGYEASLPLSLFARFWNSAATKYANVAKARIYGVKIYENDVIVRDFVPCLKEGVACFKDMVNGGFIVGENVSAFTAGGDNVPTYSDDGYVSTAANETGGHLYFDTDYIVTPKTAVAIDCALSENCVPTEGGVNMNAYLFDSFPRFYLNFVKYLNTSNYGLRYENAFSGFSNSNAFSPAFPQPVDDKDVRRTFFIDNNNCVAGVVTSGFTNQTVTAESSSLASSGSITLKLCSSYGGKDCHAPLKIYGCKIWEEGALKRDYVPWLKNGVPGLLDNVSGAFLEATRYTDDTTSTLAYGGAIKGEQDAYLESDGTTGLNTGYKMNGNSRLEVDFAMIDPSGSGRVFGSYGGGTSSYESSLLTTVYLNSGTHFNFVVGPWNEKVTKYKAGIDTDRHTAIIDLPNDRLVFMTGSETNAFTDGQMATWTGLDFTGKEADLPLSLFARFWNSTATSYANVSKAKIYSVRIYESGTLVHEFLPYGGGAVTGLYDTVTGDVISNGSSFTFGGAGYDHGSLKARIKSGYPAKLAHRGTTTLTAYAPGANSYKWLMDGQPISGGTDGVLSVEWARGGTKTDDGYVHAYQAVAVYDNFYGVARDGEPSDAATITSELLGMTIVVK